MSRRLKKENEIVLILPVHMIENHPLLAKHRTIVIVEHPRYFTDFAFHKQKLIFHRASMRDYYDQLRKKGYTVLYYEYHAVQAYLSSLEAGSLLYCLDPVDHDLKQSLIVQCKRRTVTLIWYESPLFITNSSWIEKNFSHKRHLFMHSFYMKQRKRLDILMDKNKPLGNAWSFDQENRKTIPAGMAIPTLPPISVNAYVAEARAYVTHHFPDNPGDDSSFMYPTNTQAARRWFQNFLKKRYRYFGPYQDAMQEGKSFLFHSILSPLLNVGLIDPHFVVTHAVEYGLAHGVAYSSIEGFIRQIIGWREFVRAVYQVTGKEQKRANFFKNSNPLPLSFYTAKTGIDPVDDVIRRVQVSAYSHHIERLMVLGNIMLLLEVHPNSVYRWFMEMYIDSYDWVMTPNVYGMSQYADPRMTTKPYLGGSHYICAMSNYKKGAWCAIWDALLWSFIKKHEKKLIKIPRMRFMMNALRKKSPVQMKKYKELRKKYMQGQ